MKLYRLQVVIRKPSEETEGRYLAEVPALAGCRAWGDSPGQALEYLQSVATAFLESYRAHGEPLPPELEQAGAELTEQAKVAVIG